MVGDSTGLRLLFFFFFFFFFFVVVVFIKLVGVQNTVKTSTKTPAILSGFSPHVTAPVLLSSESVQRYGRKLLRVDCSCVASMAGARRDGLESFFLRKI